MPNSIVELAIIGAGPAGLSAAIYAGRAELETVVFEKNLPGGQVSQTLDIANYPGFPDGVDGLDLAEKMRKQAERFGVSFQTGEITRVTRDADKHFRLERADPDARPLTAKAVIVATGAAPNTLDVPGEDRLRGRGVSYCGVCDGPFFKNKRVAVVGGGDSALKEALHLARFASELTLIHRRDTFRAEMAHQTAIRNNPKITLLMPRVVAEIRGEKKVEALALAHPDGSDAGILPVDGVFIFVGSTPNSQAAAELVKTGPTGQIPTDVHMATLQPGVYVVGDLREGSYRQIATAVGEGATAAMAAEHWLRA